jgi:hypothetical protein
MVMKSSKKNLVHEREWQRAVHRLLANSERRFVAADGREFQVVAPGLMNVHEGPDFTHMAILCNGTVFIGEGEFHRNEQEWFAHNHHKQWLFTKTILHVVCSPSNNHSIPVAEFVVTITKEELQQHQATNANLVTNTEVAEIQEYAHSRLMRNIRHSTNTLHRVGFSAVLRALTAQWAERSLRKRHRPNTIQAQASLGRCIERSAFSLFLRQINEYQPNELCNALMCAEQFAVAKEGYGLRRELVTNVVFPLACALATNQQLPALLQWYWSTPALLHYSALSRRFPNIPQTYVWQQQGMLECIATHQKATPVFNESRRRYGLAT